ncbi:ferritin [Christensenellaceae bacterium OttesenSCG-928-M15]|nr:ferritin [Christensenellaceae bacterium OttesenSCG-928-M15]
MLKATLENLINHQFNRELHSSYLYLAMADYYSSVSLKGFSHWFFVQAKEELDQAVLIMQFLHQNGNRVIFRPIEAPEMTFGDYLAPLKATLEHEFMVTSGVNEIYDAAVEQKEYRTMQFFDWFLKEQAKEEKEAQDLVARYNIAGGDGKGIFLLDQEMGMRAYVERPRLETV